MTETTKTVLVVDDDEDFRTQMQMQLEAAGFNVVAASGETEADKALSEKLPDLAIVDIMLENLDGGFTLCYRMKRKSPKLPVIIVSAVHGDSGISIQPETEDAHAWIKADAILTKPVRFEQLLREIDHLLKG